MRQASLIFFYFVLTFYTVSGQNRNWEKELLILDSVHQASNSSRALAAYMDFLGSHKNDSAAKGAVYRRLGNVYRDQGNLEASLFYQLRAMELADEHEDILSNASSLNNIASLYYSLGDREQALRYFLESYRLFGLLAKEKSIAKKGQSDLALNLSSIYQEMEKYGEARHFLDLSFVHLRDFGDTTEIIYLYLLEGELAAVEGKMKSWESSLNRADNYFRTHPDPYAELLFVQQKADFFARSGAKDSVKGYLEKALDLAYTLENTESIRNTAKSLSTWFDQSGDSLEAYHYLKIYQVFNDSLLDAGRIKAMIDAEQKYQNIAKTRDLEQRELELKKRRFQLLFMGSLCLLLFVLSVLLVQNRNKTKKLAEKELQLKDSRIRELMQEQELKSIDAMLKGQDEERQRIAQDLHDRLGSILSTVKLHFSTMEEEIRKLQDKQHQSYRLATEMLDEAVDEVRKISHDLHSGSISKFGLKTAVNQLIQAIESSNAIHIQFFDNQIDGQDYASFEVELYRIIQELLSNTLKHAGATEVNMQLTRSEGFITFSYEDNGKGMDPEILKKSEGLGMVSIQNRVRKINGRSTLDSTPGHGFTFIIEIPL
ncbi:MAG: tetratricopeptide repeat-containing sensor histidine kinase [Bacteroidia bacterium]